jgi:hypothetical protein
VQRDLRVGAVQRLPSPVRLDVDRVPGGDERREVRDRVVHDEALAGAFDVQRLVEVHRLLRVDGDERDVRSVQLRAPGVRRRLDGSPLDLRGELRRDLHLLLEPRDALLDGLRLDAGVRAYLDDSARHVPHPTTTRTRAVLVQGDRVPGDHDACRDPRLS